MVYADEIEDLKLEKQLVNPDSFYYPAKRYIENLQNMFMFSKDSKVNLHKNLLKKRASELKYIVEDRVLSELERGSQRFAYQAGILVEEAEKDYTEQGKKEIKDQFSKYKKLLDQLRDNFKANSSFWMLIQQDIDTLDILSEKI